MTKYLRRKDDGYCMAYNGETALADNLEIVDLPDGVNPQPEQFLAEGDRAQVLAEKAKALEKAAKEAAAAAAKAKAEADAKAKAAEKPADAAAKS